MTMRVVLADDQPQVRSALCCLLEEEPGLYVVGDAAEMDELWAQLDKTCPDLLLLDWELPGLNVQALRDLRARFPGLLVIALSGRPEACHAALAGGADVFVSKGDPPERLLATLRAVDPRA